MDQYVVKFDVSVHYSISIHIVESIDYLSDDVPAYWLRKTTKHFKKLSETSPIAILKE